jgi:hypothetical protein
MSFAGDRAGPFDISACRALAKKIRQYILFVGTDVAAHLDHRHTARGKRGAPASIAAVNSDGRLLA